MRTSLLLGRPLTQFQRTAAGRNSSTQWHNKRLAKFGAAPRLPRRSVTYSTAAHRSARALLDEALAVPANRRPSPAQDFAAKSNVVPALKLLLPPPMERMNDMTSLCRLEERRRTANHDAQPSDHPLSTTPAPSTARRRSLVAVPFGSVSVLGNKQADHVGAPSDNTVARFLAHSKALQVSCADGVVPSHTPIATHSSSFTIDDVGDMFRLAALYEIPDSEFILRLTGELERYFQKRHEVAIATVPSDRECLNAEREERDRAATTSQADDVHERWLLHPTTCAKILFFASEIGFLEEHAVNELIATDVSALLRRRQFTTREMVHVAIALSRFHASNTDEFRAVTKRLATLCRGVQIAMSDHRRQQRSTDTDGPPPLSSSSSMPPVTLVAPTGSFCHPECNLSAKRIAELAKAFAESEERSDTVADALALRLLYLRNAPDPHDRPTAHQLQFVLRTLELMGLWSGELRGALLVDAGKESNGVILCVEGSTAEEEGAHYDEFSADLLKAS